MVLLTSSTISIAISSSIVCTFTFLLFLSGYVLQQQTVRSLQQALRQPPEPKPTPTWQATFQTVLPIVNVGEGVSAAGGALVAADVIDIVVDTIPHTPENNHEGMEVLLDTLDPEQYINRVRPIGQDLRAGLSTEGSQEEAFATNPTSSSAESAYILSLLNPASLCAALLFSKHHAQHSNLPREARPSIILLYPSTWETRPTEASLSALALLRTAMDSPVGVYGQLILHPVPINHIWSGMLEGQLLAELQRGRFPYKRMLYLRVPGLAIDIPTLDAALTTSDLRQSWAPLSSDLAKASSVAGGGSIAPPAMLVSPTRGLLVPRSSLRHLITTVSTHHENHHENEMDIEAQAANKGAAWVVFDEAELEHRRGEKEWYGSVVERFERGRREVCHGSGLL